MGQQSSQISSLQTPQRRQQMDNTTNSNRGSASSSSSASSDSEAGSPRDQETPVAPSEGRAEQASEIMTAGATEKLSVSQSTNSSKLRRYVPQSRRGTNIKPQSPSNVEHSAAPADVQPAADAELPDPASFAKHRAHERTQSQQNSTADPVGSQETQNRMESPVKLSKEKALKTAKLLEDLNSKASGDAEDGNLREKGRKKRMRPTNGPTELSLQTPSTQESSALPGTSQYGQPELSSRDAQSAQDHVLTPPTSRGNATGRAKQRSMRRRPQQNGNAERVDVYDLPGSPEPSPTAANTVQAMKSAKKRKRDASESAVTPKPSQKKARSLQQEGGEDDLAGDHISTRGSTEKENSPPGRRKRSSKNSIDYGEDSGSFRTKVGPFSEEEKDRVDEVFEQICRTEKMDRAELTRRITEEWRSIPAFKQDLYDAFPERDIRSLRKLCQRRFHTYERGEWNAESDNALRKAYLDNPDQWRTIGDKIGRSGQSCRDRYVNYLAFKTKLKTGLWTEREEMRLSEAIAEARVKIEKKHPNMDEDQMTELLDWKAIAAEVRTRSNRRCRQKYARMKGSSTDPFQHMHVTEQKPTNDDSSEISASESEDSDEEIDSLPDALDAIDPGLARYGSGDLFDILTEIHNSLKDDDPSGEEDQQWFAVARHNRDSRFKSKTRKRVYHAVLSLWSRKKDLREQHSLGAKAGWMAHKVEVMHQSTTLERRYKVKDVDLTRQSQTTVRDGTEVVAGVESPKKNKKKSRPVGSTKVTGKTSLSEDVVHDSDE